MKNRRDFLSKGAGVLTTLFVSNSYSGEFGSCKITSSQTSGSFYPGEKKIENLVDLTANDKTGLRAEGQVIYIFGSIKNSQCEPIKSAVVEIWQACTTGKYDHERDPNPALIDPNLKYSARAITDLDGNYNFKTIIPGSYPAGQGWIRPPHIHFRVAALGYKELTTQMYFKGNQLNDKDLILLDTPAEQRGALVLEFFSSDESFENGSLFGTFDLTLEKINR